MAEVVVATLNVSFSDDTAGIGGVLKLEIDDREDGLNNGNTSFKPGDSPAFFMFKDSNVNIVVPPRASAGGITGSGSGTKEIDENITFSNSDTASLNYPPDGGVTMSWLGNSYNLEGTTVTSNSTLPDIELSSLKMPDGKQIIGVLNCKYNSTGSLHKLQSVAKDMLEVIIFAVGTVEPLP